jgi:hypothetical protein
MAARRATVIGPAEPIRPAQPNPCGAFGDLDASIDRSIDPGAAQDLSRAAEAHHEAPTAPAGTQMRQFGLRCRRGRLGRRGDGA